MAKVLIIGAGGVSSVVVHKCAQAAEVFDEIVLASRTRARCDANAADVKERTGTGRADQAGQAAGGAEHRPALSGSAHHGRLPGSGRALS